MMRKGIQQSVKCKKDDSSGQLSIKKYRKLHVWSDLLLNISIACLVYSIVFIAIYAYTSYIEFAYASAIIFVVTIVLSIITVIYNIFIRSKHKHKKRS